MGVSVFCFVSYPPKVGGPLLVAHELQWLGFFEMNHNKEFNIEIPTIDGIYLLHLVVGLCQFCLIWHGGSAFLQNMDLIHP